MPPPPGTPPPSPSTGPAGFSAGPAMWSLADGAQNGGWGSGPAQAQPPEAKAPSRLGEGFLVGVAAAAVAGALWWAVVAATQTQFVYGAIAVGLLVGQGMLIGVRRAGPVAGLLAAAFTLVSLAVSEYFIQRSLAISQAGIDVPLWTDLTFAKDVVREGLKAEPLTGLFWGIAAIAALLSAGLPSRKPLI